MRGSSDASSSTNSTWQKSEGLEHGLSDVKMTVKIAVDGISKLDLVINPQKNGTIQFPMISFPA